jgi:hypothetical protein
MFPDAEAAKATAARPPVAVEGLLVRALFAARDVGYAGSPLSEPTLPRVAVPWRSALACAEVVYHGAALLAPTTPGAKIDRTRRALELARRFSPIVHHFPSTRSTAA